MTPDQTPGSLVSSGGAGPKSAGAVPAYIDPLRRIRGFLLAQNPHRRLTQTNVQGRYAYLVPSASKAGVAYDVFVDEDGSWNCVACVDFAAERQPCQHIVEVLDRYFEGALAPPDPKLLLKIVGDKAGKMWYADARRLPYEPYEFKEGLAESTRQDHAYIALDDDMERLALRLGKWLNAKYPPLKEAGRRPLPPGDKVAGMLLRAHHRKSIRGSVSIFGRLEREGKIAFAPCKNTLLSYNIDEETLGFLKEAYERAVAVFREMETEVIADSTGESPFHVANWCMSDYGTKNLKVNTEWLKLHVLIGRKSKAILAFRLTPFRGEGTGDSTVFPFLLQDVLKRGFDVVKYALADNTYLTKENWEFARSRHITLISPFKARNFDDKGVPRKSVEAAAKFRAENPEIYDEKKRARNVVESVFSALKRLFGRLAAMGTEEERENRADLLKAAEGATTEADRAMFKDAAAAASVYVSRQIEVYLQVICQVLRATAKFEHYHDRKFRYDKDYFFGPYFESVEVDDVA